MRPGHEHEAARALVAEMTRSGALPFDMAIACAATGEVDRAVDQILRAADEMDVRVPFVPTYLPHLGIMDHPRRRELLARVNRA